MLSSGDICDYVHVLRTLDPSGQHIPDLGLCVDQWLQSYDLIDQESSIEEITMNGGEKGSNAIRARASIHTDWNISTTSRTSIHTDWNISTTSRTSIHTDWNISTTLNSNPSKPVSIADLHSSGQSQVTVISGEPIAVFALTQRTESAASTINWDNEKTAAPVQNEKAKNPYKTEGKRATEVKRKLRDKHSQNANLKKHVSASKRQLKTVTDGAKKQKIEYDKVSWACF